jgi:hypothetical protein
MGCIATKGADKNKGFIQLRVTSYELQLSIIQLRVTSYELRTAINHYSITSYELRVTNCN